MYFLEFLKKYKLYNYYWHKQELFLKNKKDIEKERIVSYNRIRIKKTNGKFQSNLREVLLFIKYSKNKEKLIDILKKNQERFQQIERRAMDVIETITNIGFQYEESEVTIDMCEAIQEIRTEERNIGIQIGKQIGEQVGKQIGEQIGKQIGKQIGEQEKAQEVTKNLYGMGINVEKIAQAVGYTVETVKEWLNL